jgi:16S rRNA (uracil1498-N3)-methyltransferase
MVEGHQIHETGKIESNNMNSEHNWFYVPPEHISKSSIVFPKKTAHHVLHVLRKKEHETILVTDGQGNLYTARMQRVERSTWKAEILERKVYVAPEPPYIDLAIVPLKGNRTETVVEKGKELGIHKFILFISQYAVVKELKTAKIERYRHVMISAMIQSRQCMVSPVVSFSDLRSFAQEFKGYDHVLVADPNGSKELPRTGESILLVVGPEGGFSRDELLLFDQAGARTISLGQRRLRSETAAIAGIVKVLVVNRRI